MVPVVLDGVKYDDGNEIRKHLCVMVSDGNMWWPEIKDVNLFDIPTQLY